MHYVVRIAYFNAVHAGVCWADARCSRSRAGAPQGEYPMRTRLSTFLDSHVGGTYRDDVGPLFGQANEIRNHRFADQTSRRWHEAVNAALTSEATRETAKRRARTRSTMASR